MIISDAINLYKDYVKASKTEATLKFYSFYFKRIETFFNEIEVENIGKPQVTSFIAYVKRESPKIKNVSINKYLITLKAVIKYSTDRVLEFKKLTEQKPLIPTISQGTINQVFDHLRKHLSDSNLFRNYVIFRLLLDTGLRINELCHLTVNDLDISTNTFHVKVTKTKNDRYVFFTDSTKQLLLRYIVAFEPKTLLFYSSTTKGILSTSSIESIVHRLKKRLKLNESITPHKWRHTFATDYVNKGGNLETLRLILGHSSLKTTQKYLHLSKKNILDEYTKVMRNTDKPEDKRKETP
jgi:integrase/recombinase XerD